jgi:hypothetical protein
MIADNEERRKRNTLQWLMTHHLVVTADIRIQLATTVSQSTAWSKAVSPRVQDVQTSFPVQEIQS